MLDNFLDSLDEKEEGEKRYRKSNFRYDEARDTYVCPEGGGSLQGITFRVPETIDGR
jgi:hypothetical protein